LHAEIPAGQLPIFYAKLRELGDLQVSPETGTEKDSDTVQITIRIVGQQ
jgi:hypothetical protein